MRPEMCLICTDIRCFDSKLHDVERINRCLAQYVTVRRDTIMMDDRELWSHLSMDRRHVNFMCGACPRISESKLRNEERQLAKTVYYICKEMESGRSYPVGEILRLLQGHYPIMYRCIERRRHERIRNIV